MARPVVRLHAQSQAVLGQLLQLGNYGTLYTTGPKLRLRLLTSGTTLRATGLSESRAHGLCRRQCCSRALRRAHCRDQDTVRVRQMCGGERGGRGGQDSILPGPRRCARKQTQNPKRKAGGQPIVSLLRSQVPDHGAADPNWIVYKSSQPAAQLQYVNRHYGGFVAFG